MFKAFIFLSLMTLARAFSAPTIETMDQMTKEPLKTYRAAVVQAPVNYDVDYISTAAAKAKAAGAQIMIFPENGPWQDAPVGTYPSPGTTSLCNATDTNILSRVACIAKDNGLYIVYNTIDVQPCAEDVEPDLCRKWDAIANGYKFNANMVLNPKGALAAKYYKHMLFGGSNFLTQTNTKLSDHFNANGVFTSSFGVKFGVAICNDLNGASFVPDLVREGVRDILFSNSWDDGESQQSIQTIMTGISYMHSVTILGASSSDTSSGSGFYSSGNIIKASMEPGCIPLVVGVTPPQAGKALCESVVIADIPIQLEPTAVDAPNMPSSPSEWKTIGEQTSCAAIQVSKLLEAPGVAALAEYGPGASFARNSAVGKVMGGLGNVGVCQELVAPPPGASFATIAVEGGKFGDVSCRFDVDVSAASKAGETYMVQASATHTWVPYTPCPLAFAICVLSRCLEIGTNAKQCVTLSVGTGKPVPAGLTRFNSAALTGTFPRGTSANPNVGDSDYNAVPIPNLKLEGPFQESAPDLPTFVMQSVEETFTFMSLQGYLPVTWPDYCTECHSPSSYADTSSAQFALTNLFYDKMCML